MTTASIKEAELRGISASPPLEAQTDFEAKMQCDIRRLTSAPSSTALPQGNSDHGPYLGNDYDEDSSLPSPRRQPNSWLVLNTFCSENDIHFGNSKVNNAISESNLMDINRNDGWRNDQIFETNSKSSSSDMSEVSFHLEHPTMEGQNDNHQKHGRKLRDSFVLPQNDTTRSFRRRGQQWFSTSCPRLNHDPLTTADNSLSDSSLLQRTSSHSFRWHKYVQLSPFKKKKKIKMGIGGERGRKADGSREFPSDTMLRPTESLLRNVGTTLNPNKKISIATRRQSETSTTSFSSSIHSATKSLPNSSIIGVFGRVGGTLISKRAK